MKLNAELIGKFEKWKSINKGSNSIPLFKNNKSIKRKQMRVTQKLTNHYPNQRFNYEKNLGMAISKIIHEFKK